MLGLLLFISSLAVLIICARMHDCHVLILWVRESVILIRIIEKQTQWKFDRSIISKLVLLYVSHNWRVVLSLMIDSQCRCAIIRCHMAGEYYQARNWTLTVSSDQWVRWHRTEKISPKERKNRINRYKIKCLKCTPNVVTYSRIKRRGNICPGFLRVKTCTNKNISISSSWCFWFNTI